MAQQVLVKLELDGGKWIEHYSSIKIRQNIFQHHEFEIIVPFEVLEKEGGNFFAESYRNVCGKIVSFSFESVYDTFTNKEGFDFVFKGIITSISLRNQGDLYNSFVVSGYSPTILLEDMSIKKTYHKKTVGDMFTQMLGTYPSNTLKHTVKANHKGEVPYIVQYNETNYQFLSRLADEYGEWFYYNGQELLVGREKKKEVKFQIDGVQAFDLSISLKPSKFQVGGYVYSTDSEHSSESSSQNVEGLGQLGDFALRKSDEVFNQQAVWVADKPIFAQKDLDDLAKVKKSMVASKLIVFKGNGEVPNLSVGTVINVQATIHSANGTSTQDCGKYVITEIEHTVDSDGTYSNSFKALPDSVKFPPPNPYVVRPQGQPELAVITHNEDPDKMGRVKVKFYWPTRDSNDTDWIRVGVAYSGGGGKGMLFIPEVGSQVLVDYELNHPEYPFVVTSVYPKRKDVRTAGDKNEEKFIYTMAGNQISLNDKSGQNKIEISNVNKADTAITIEFKDNGIITLKTKGKVEITADETISISAKQKISLEAQDIEIKAQNSLKMEATASAELKTAQLKFNADATAELKAGASLKLEAAMTEVSATGINTIKGAVVKLN